MIEAATLPLRHSVSCQTTVYGTPCSQRAAWHVSGRFIRPHLCCEAHQKGWMGIGDGEFVAVRLQDARFVEQSS